MTDSSHDRPLVGSLEVQTGANVVIAETIQNLHVHAPPESPKTPLGPFASLPPLPPNFIDRPELSELLVEKLLSSTAMVAITAIEGMGGVGKTVLALNLCYAPEVRAAFPDGIVWLTIGKEANTSLEKRMEWVAKHLNQEFRVYSEAAYRTLLSNKAVLVVLDDVWSLEAVEPFLMDPGRSRLLYTSRDRSLAGRLNAEEQQVGVLDDAQARRFLAKWSGRDSVAPPEPYASEILAECNGLVLGLAMIGAALNGQPDSEWADMVTDLKNARLKVIGKRPVKYGYETLHASIAVSVDALDPDAKARYLRLAVLLEDMPAPEALLRALWGGEEEDVRRAMRLFVDRSLASRDAAGNIRGEHSDPTALALEHSALLRSLHVVSSHSEQFASQMTGRLLTHQAQSGVAAFLKDLEASAPRPRLRPLWPALELAGGPALRVLEGHTHWVNAVALSGDGKRAVSGSNDKTVRVWDLEGNQPPRILEGHTGSINAVALSGDGKRAISGSWDHIVSVWDLEGNQPPRILEGHTGPVNAVALSSDGKRAVSGSNDKTVRVWDLEGNQPPRLLEGHTSPIWAVALSGDGQRALSSSYDETLRVWDLKGNQPPRLLEGHTGDVRAVALSADGKRAIAGSDDRTVRVWDLEGNQPPRLLEGHEGPVKAVRAVALSGDGKRAISGSWDYIVRVWDLEGNQPPRLLKGHTREIGAVALSGDGQRAVSGSWDKTVRVWDLESNQPPRILEGNAEGVNAVALSGDGKRAIAGSDDRTVRVWDLEGNRPPRLLKGHTREVEAVALSGDGKRAVSGSNDHTVRVWDLESNQPPRILEGQTWPVNVVVLSWDGQRAVSGYWDGTLLVWDLEGIQPPRILEGNEPPRLLEGYKPPRSLDGYRGPVVALSGNGQRAVAGGIQLRVWDLEGNQPPRILDGNTGGVKVKAVALSGDGWRVVTGAGTDILTGSDDKTVRVWDLKGNQPPRILEGHTRGVNAVALSIDGQHIVSGSEDHTLRVWDLETGKCLAVITCDAPVNSCAWAGERIVAGDASGHVHLFAWEE
jgi:WD40 repeat protein